VAPAGSCQDLGWTSGRDSGIFWPTRTDPARASGQVGAPIVHVVKEDDFMRRYPQRRPHRADASGPGPHGKDTPRPVSRRRLLFEDLEDRSLMSVGVADAPISATGMDLNAIAGVPFQAPLATINDSGSSGANYGLSIDWGDGQTSTSASLASNQAPQGSATAVIGMHTYAQAGTYHVHVAINDPGGSSASADDTATVAENPSPPTEGQPYNGPVATLTLDDPHRSAKDLRAEIQWNGAQGGPVSTGTIAPDGHGGFVVSGQHTFTEEGTATPHVTVDLAPSGPEAEGPLGRTHVADLTGPLQVADAPLSASGATLAATAGQAVSGVVAHVGDANPTGAVDDLHASIAWGDGSSTAGTLAPDSSPPTAGASGVQFQVTGSHTYATPGTYDLQVQINDQGGATASADGQATVPASPTSTPTPPPTTPATPSGPATGTDPGGGLPAWFSSWRWFWAGWDSSKTWVARNNNPTPGGS
jgi:hypothetical protein